MNLSSQRIYRNYIFCSGGLYVDDVLLYPRYLISWWLLVNLYTHLFILSIKHLKVHCCCRNVFPVFSALSHCIQIEDWKHCLHHSLWPMFCWSNRHCQAWTMPGKFYSPAVGNWGDKEQRLEMLRQGSPSLALKHAYIKIRKQNKAWPQNTWNLFCRNGVQAKIWAIAFA